jgi:hypothetical protein
MCLKLRVSSRLIIVYIQFINAIDNYENKFENKNWFLTNR